jgi:hypothetical protein
MSRGRPRHRSVCESCLSLDIRTLHRDGRILYFKSFPVSWKIDGELVGTILVQTKYDGLNLIFSPHDPGTAPSKRIEQRVPVTWTACTLGGRRPWFICAAHKDGQRCGRRVAKLYLGHSPVFACRHCYDLAYSSQFEQVGYRGIGLAMKIRTQLGGSPNLMDPFPNKPKGLHWKTYHRLRKVHDAAENRSS